VLAHDLFRRVAFDPLREALKANASKPGAIGVASSRLKAWARSTTSWGS